MNIENPISGENNGLRWLFVDMNSFFASCEQQRNAELRGQPIAIAPTDTEKTCVIAASYEAKKFGIKTGTPIWEARELCPHIKIVLQCPKLYVEYHHAIADAIETCIPIEAVLSVDEVACRLDKIQCHPDKAYALALDIKAAIRDRVGAYLTCSIGVASNKLLAKLASDMKKPDGLVILRPSDLPNAILHLKMDDICGIGPNMIERLKRNGIRDMAALWAADAYRLRQIWNGVVGLRFHTLLHGADLPSPINPRRSMGHQHVLAPEDRTKEKATPVMRQLLNRVAQRLRDDGFYTRRMFIEIKWTQNLGYFAEETTFKETQDTGYLLSALMRLWDKVPNFKPLRIGVTLADLKPIAAHQPDLFDKPKYPKLTQAIDELNEKYGRDTVRFGPVALAMTSKISFTRVPKLKEF